MITGKIGSGRAAFFTQEEVDTLSAGRTWEGLPDWCLGLPLVPLATLLGVGAPTCFIPDGYVAYTYKGDK